MFDLIYQEYLAQLEYVPDGNHVLEVWLYHVGLTFYYLYVRLTDVHKNTEKPVFKLGKIDESNTEAWLQEVLVSFTSQETRRSPELTLAAETSSQRWD
jgi:hypothetical protein